MYSLVRTYFLQKQRYHMSVLASLTTGNSVVCPMVCSGKHHRITENIEASHSWHTVCGIHWWHMVLPLKRQLIGRYCHVRISSYPYHYKRLRHASRPMPKSAGPQYLQRYVMSTQYNAFACICRTRQKLHCLSSNNISPRVTGECSSDNIKQNIKFPY